MKYLHLLLHNEIKFNEKLFCLLNNAELGFDGSEHWFITPFQGVYDELKKYENNISLLEDNNLKLINQCGSQADWVFIHALNLRKYQVIRIRKKTAKKVIWRVWGHDILEKPNEKGIIRQIGKQILDKLYVRKIRQFYGIGTGFKYDNLLIKERYGNIRSFPLGYTYQPGKEEIYQRIEEKARKSHEKLRICIGHSGNRIMNHIKIMKSLEHLSGLPIQIVLVLAYGDKKYINEIKEYAYKHFKPEEVDIIEEFLPIEKYLEVIESIDIAVFDQKGSAALGNLTPLMFFEKKFVFNQEGLMKQVFDKENLDYLTSDNLSTISFDQLKESFQSQEKERGVVEQQVKDNYVPNTWKELLNNLSQYTRRNGQ